MKVMIDPGHGGNDNGAAWGSKLDYIEEDDTNLSIANLVYLMLQLNGLKVDLTRTRDEYITLTERAAMANRLNSDIFVSIHCDAFHKETANGMTVYHYEGTKNQKTVKLAHCIADQMAWTFKDHRFRGVKTAKYTVLEKTRMPAVLIECEFVSNPETRRFLKEPEKQFLLAESITGGIVDFFNSKGVNNGTF